MDRRTGPAVRLFDLSIDPAILLEATAITAAAGLISGLGPALLETRRLHGNPMRTLSSPERVRQRWRHALVVADIAVTVALLVVTATLVDGYRRHFTNDVGYRTRPLLLIRVDNNDGVPIERIRGVLRALPGVAAADASTSLPYFASGPMQRLSAGRDDSRAVRAERVSIGPDFFATLDVPMRAGRAFTAQDSSATRTAIVNQTLARRRRHHVRSSLAGVPRAGRADPGDRSARHLDSVPPCSADRPGRPAAHQLTAAGPRRAGHRLRHRHASVRTCHRKPTPLQCGECNQ